MCTRPRAYACLVVAAGNVYNGSSSAAWVVVVQACSIWSHVANTAQATMRSVR
jgi:hypothetical protein